MTTTATSTAARSVELPPGYYLDEHTGAWLSLPWPSSLEELPPSLGPAAIRWAEHYLRDHITGAQWRYTVAQRRFLHLWYALRPDGKWLYRSGVKRGAKGTGKDPLLASMTLIEACGPVVFAGWAADGSPLAMAQRMALVQVAANSEAQAKDVLRVANGMLSHNLVDEYGVEPGVLATTFDDGSRIELLTNSERSSEGDPATALFLNESHHMTESSGGQDLAGVARRNAGKSPGGRARVLEATNAHMPGEGSVAEDSYDAWQLQVAGKTRRRDILYDTREAPPHLRLHVEEELEAGIAAAYADSPWTDRERIRDEAQDPRVPAADSVRYYFNALPTNETAWCDPRAWDARADLERHLEPADELAMFLDCSKSSDATVLAGSRLDDGHVVALGVWQRPHGDRGKGWLAPRHEVDARVREIFATYNVQWFGVDPSPAREDDTEALYWAELCDQWHRDFRSEVTLWATPGEKTGSAVLFDMRLSQRGAHDRLRAFTDQAERTVREVEEDCTLTHDGDPVMRVHVHNARRRPNQWGVSLSKATRSSSKLVDYAVAMVGARLGRRLVLNSPKRRKRKRRGRVAAW